MTIKYYVALVGNKWYNRAIKGYYVKIKKVFYEEGGE